MSDLVVVTGGAGFIGSNVVAALNEQGMDDIIIVDRLGENEKWKNLMGLRFEDFVDKAEFVELLMRDAFEPVDTIIHMGACSSTTERDADYLMRNNYQYTSALCKWSLDCGARFIYASSAATYGDGSMGYADSEEIIRGLEPMNMYGYSKHMFDLWALKTRLFDRIVGLKYFNVYGPREDHKGEMRSVVHKAYQQICATGEAKLFKSHKPEYKDGEQVRDFIYVKDAVDVTLHFYGNRETSGLFNCGTGQARTWIDLATAVFAGIGTEPNIRFIDMPEELRAKYQYFTEADITKLRHAGYTRPFTPLEEGIGDYIQNYLAVKK